MINKVQNWFMFLPKDKILHFGISCLIVLGVSGIFKDLNVPLRIILSSLTALTIGIIKEIYDLIVKKTEFSWSDILADVLGIILGILIIIYV